jgi:putative nucleotidyltransferase with HDIG domain
MSRPAVRGPAWPPTAADRRWAAGQLTATASSLAAALLAELPDRRAHCELAGRQARRLAAAVPAADRDLLIAAAHLHDIGYARALRHSGFHPLDGARYLTATGAPPRLAALVAHHSEARLLARPRGLLPELDTFDREVSAVSDALTCADMTSGPTGEPMTIEARLRDLEARHRHEDPELFAARLARVPRLLAAAERVRRRTGRPAAVGEAGSPGTSEYSSLPGT